MRIVLLGATGFVGSVILKRSTGGTQSRKARSTTTQASGGGIYAAVFNVAELRCILPLALLATSACMKNSTEGSTLTITPRRMQRVGAVDERYQSYNVEMLEVTGGRFWRPYSPSLRRFSNNPHRPQKRPRAIHPQG